MTDNEIIKALECCKNGKCITQNCPYSHYPYEGDECYPAMAKDALDLINRQKAEIKRLEKSLTEQFDCYENIRKKAKAEAIKEFAERLKAKATEYMRDGNVDVFDIDNLVKEMTEKGGAE